MREMQATELKLSKLILLSLLSQIGFGLPVIALLMAISVLDFEAGLFFLGISLGLVGPILGFFSWLIAKGSIGTSIEAVVCLTRAFLWGFSWGIDRMALCTSVR